MYHFATDRHGWAELLPEARCPRPSLTGKHRARWAVIGAGFTGLACARRLGQLHPDDDMLLLDAREVGQGASGRNSGFAVATSHFSGGVDARRLDNCRRVNRINRAGLAQLEALIARHAIDCQWRREGFFHTAADRASMRECAHFLRSLDALEVEHDNLDADELHARLGTALYRAGVHVADGALVQPAALVRGLADTLPANVTLHERSPVVAMVDGKPVSLRLADAEVRADKVIVAANYEAPRLGLLGSGLAGSTLAGSFTRRLTREELDSLGSLDAWGVLSLHSGGATVRLTNDGRLSIRNTAEYHGARLLSDAVLERRQSVHRAAFERRFPQLVHVPFEYAWSGVEGITRNGTNFFGRHGAGIFFAGGYNGSGVTRGTAFGTAIGDYASGESTALVSDCLASPRAKRIPPRPLLDIGAYFLVRARFRGVGLDR